MSMFSFKGISIKAIAAAVPTYVHTFDQSSKRVARFSKQMGIDEVHISLTEQTSLDVGYAALTEALNHISWQSKDLDLVIFNTQSPDFRGGVGNSSLLHKYLGLREDCAVFDMTAGCAAIPYMVSVAASMMTCASDIRRVAVLCGDCKWMQFKNPDEIKALSVSLSGEGVGVIILENKKSYFVENDDIPPLTVELFAQGTGYLNLLNLPSLKNVWHQSDEYIMPDGAHWHIGHSDYKNYMNGMAIHEFVTTHVCINIKERWGAKLPSYDYFAFHQANQQILDLLCSNLGIAPERMLSSLKHYGNTSNASVLITLCAHADKLKSGAHIFSAGYGMGLAWGFIDLTLPAGTVLPIISTEHRFTEHMLKPVTPEA